MPKLLYVWYYPSIDQARSASGGCRSIDVHICRIQIKFQRTMGQRKGARMAFYVIKDILASTLDTLLRCLQQKTNNLSTYVTYGKPSKSERIWQTK